MVRFFLRELFLAELDQLEVTFSKFPLKFKLCGTLPEVCTVETLWNTTGCDLLTEKCPETIPKYQETALR